MNVRQVTEEEWQHISRTWSAAVKFCSIRGCTMQDTELEAGFIFEYDGYAPLELCANGLHFYQTCGQGVVMNPMHCCYPVWTYIYYDPSEVIHAVDKSVCRRIYIPTERQSAVYRNHPQDDYMVVRNMPLISKLPSSPIDYIVEQIILEAIEIIKENDGCLEAAESYITMMADCIKMSAECVMHVDNSYPYYTVADAIITNNRRWHLGEEDYAARTSKYARMVGFRADRENLMLRLLKSEWTIKKGV